MNFLDPEYRGLTSDQLQWIDRVCGEYEQHRMEGRNGLIEDIVSAAPDSVRRVLELELIRIEFEIAASWYQLPPLDDWVRRFPNSADSIKTEWHRWTKQSQRTQSGNQNDPQRETFDLHNQQTPAVGSDRAAFSSADASVDTPIELNHRFRILRRIAEGGIGTVYAAFDNDLQREVALKELKGSLVHQSSVVHRFLAEATITSHLEHPNIVPIYAVGQRSDGRHYYAMRLIRGRSLQAAISELHRLASQSSASIDFRRNPSARDLLLRFVTVCRAVGFAHSRGIIHRDLKPANIMVGDFGETLIVDWGLARRHTKPGQSSNAARQPEMHEQAANLAGWKDNEPASLGAQPNVVPHDAWTRDGTIVGTPGYMSPEQAEGRVDLIHETSDIFSLGATLFSLLTNSVPIENTGTAPDLEQKTTGASRDRRSNAADEKTSVRVGDGRRSADVVSPRRIIPTTPLALDAVCRRAMAPRQEDRYETPEEIALDLEAWLADEPVSVLPETSLRRTYRWLRRRPLIVGTITGGIAIAALALAITVQIVSKKNGALTTANEREKQATRNAQQQAQLAAANADDAEQQRQKIQEILQAFITDVERSLVNVPGSAVVRKRVLTQVLNQLSIMSDTIRGNTAASMNSVMALTDLGDLFAQFGADDVSGSIHFDGLDSASPSDAAAKLYDEALQVIDRQLSADPNNLNAILQKTNIQYKQASLLRQIGKTADAMTLLQTCTKVRERHGRENPDSLEWAMAIAIANDLIGQIHLQSGELDSAEAMFVRAEQSLSPFTDQAKLNKDLLRRIGIIASRLGDIAAKRGDLEKAEIFYAEDLNCSEQLARANPENLTSQRDYATAMDRLGNMTAARGRLQDALDWYLKSLSLRREILHSDPADMNSLRELFVSLMKCGDTRMTLKLVTDAKADFIAAGETADKMAAMDPKNTIARRYQSFSAEMLADIALAESDFNNALSYAVRSLDVSLELAALDPSDGQTEQDVLLCHAKVAKVYQAKGDYPAAIAQLRQAEDIANKRLKQASTLDATTNIIYLQAKLGETFLKASDFAQADQVLEAAIARLQAIPDENRSDVTLRRRMVNLPTLRAQALISLNRPDEARVLLEQARILANEMIENNERAEQLRLDLAEIEERLQSLQPKAP